MKIYFSRSDFSIHNKFHIVFSLLISVPIRNEIAIGTAKRYIPTSLSQQKRWQDFPATVIFVYDLFLIIRFNSSIKVLISLN